MVNRPGRSARPGRGSKKRIGTRETSRQENLPGMWHSGDDNEKRICRGKCHTYNMLTFVPVMARGCPNFCCRIWTPQGSKCHKLDLQLRCELRPSICPALESAQVRLRRRGSEASCKHSLANLTEVLIGIPTPCPRRPCLPYMFASKLRDNVTGHAPAGPKVWRTAY